MEKSYRRLGILLFSVLFVIVFLKLPIWSSIYAGSYWSCTTYTITYGATDNGGGSAGPYTKTYYDCELVVYYYDGGGGGEPPTDPPQDPGGGGGGATQNPSDLNNNGIIDCYKNRLMHLDGLSITSAFGTVRADGTTHKGVDIAVANCDGNNVYAAASGTVLAWGFEAGGWGNWIKIQDANGLTWVYAHLKGNPHNDSSLYGVGIKANQEVVAGSTVIGICDDTGHSDGSHVHLEVRDSAWNAINPMTKIGDC
jgi:murein DD-endopeptidase MepM/ murein hydrolase activator NlpD